MDPPKLRTLRDDGSSKTVRKIASFGEESRERSINQWRSLIAEKKWDQFVEEILVHHYDRAYEQASKRSRPNDFDRNSGERKGVDQGGADELFLENLEEQTYDDAAKLFDEEVR